MKRAACILLLLACLVSMGAAILVLLVDGPTTAVGGWFTACVASGLFGMVLDE